MSSDDEMKVPDTREIVADPPVKKEKSHRETIKVPAYTELKAKKNCKRCGGRGTLTMIPSRIVNRSGKVETSLDASKFRLVVPCPCVHATIEWHD